MVLSVRRLLLVAATVRGAYLAATLGVARLLDDYDTSASLLVGGCGDAWPQVAAKAQQSMPWVVWDSVFLHRISTCGYEYEQFFAFFPGLPGARAAAASVHARTPHCMPCERASMRGPRALLHARWLSARACACRPGAPGADIGTAGTTAGSRCACRQHAQQQAASLHAHRPHWRMPIH